MFIMPQQGGVIVLARTLLLFAIILGTCHSHLYAQPWAEKMFDSLEYDFGDLPDKYQTLLVSDGARHGIEAGFHLLR